VTLYFSLPPKDFFFYLCVASAPSNQSTLPSHTSFWPLCSALVPPLHRFASPALHFGFLNIFYSLPCKSMTLPSYFQLLCIMAIGGWIRKDLPPPLSFCSRRLLFFRLSPILRTPPSHPLQESLSARLMTGSLLPVWSFHHPTFPMTARGLERAFKTKLYSPHFTQVLSFPALIYRLIRFSLPSNETQFLQRRWSARRSKRRTQFFPPPSPQCGPRDFTTFEEP